MSRNDEITRLLPKHEEDDDLEKDLKESSVDSRNDVPKVEDSLGNQILNFYNKVLLHRNPDDDLVTVSVKKFNLFILGSLVCWLISFAMIMTQIITSYTAFSGNWLCFIPMWIGSFVGLFGVFRVFLTVCRPSSLITRERKLYLQKYYPQQFQERNYIEQQSLPLMRRLFCWSIVLAITYFLLLIAQICYYFWFIKVLSIWDSIISLTLILSTFMIYMYTVHIFNWIICILFSLFVLQLGLFIMKETGNVQASWILLSLPLFISLIGIGYYLMKILRAFFQSKYHFNYFQSFCLVGYILSYLLVATGSGLTLADSYMHDLRYVTTAYICWTVAVCIVGLCGVLVLFEEGIRSAENRGYEDPPVLTRTAEGWDVVEVEENPLLFILGAVKREKGRVNHVRRKQQEKVNDTNTTKHEKVISYQNGTFDEKKLVAEGKNKLPTKEVELKTFADRR